MGSLVEPNTEIIWLDIPVEEMSGVDVFDSLNHLVHKHQNSLQRKLPKRLVEERLERRSHQIHNEDVIVSLGGAVVNIRNSLVNNTRVVVEVVVELTFVD